MRGMADDWEVGGPIRLICRGYEKAPRAAVIGTHIEEMHAALAVPPQTNEVGRSVALLAGLFDLVAASGVRRIRLLELGASAGLNLLLDFYGFRGKSWHVGPVDSKVQFVDPIEGHVQPERFMIMNRAGCDLHPVDVATAEGRLLLTSFVWPFDLHRHQRLSSALSVAATHPVRLDKAAASNWLPEALVVDRDVLPVVWHSITQMYWPIEEVMAVESIMTSDGAQQPLAEVSLEFDLDDPRGVNLSSVPGYGIPIPTVRFASV
jgi:hypothetical protein